MGDPEAESVTSFTSLPRLKEDDDDVKLLTSLNFDFSFAFFSKNFVVYKIMNIDVRISMKVNTAFNIRTKK